MPNPREYKPSRSSSRRRIVKEVASHERRPKHGPSRRALRRDLGKMFSFTPLVKLTPAEKRCLKAVTMDTLTKHAFRQGNQADLLKAGNVETQTKAEYMRGVRKGRKPREKTQVKLLTDPKAYNDVRVIVRDPLFVSSGLSIASSASRDMEGYKRVLEASVLDLVNGAIGRKGGKIRMLDIGSSSSRVLSQVKRRKGDLVEAHGISLTDAPQFSGSTLHTLSADYLPASFRRKFDVIVSSRAFEYMLFPNYALRNAAEMLAPGGEARIQFYFGGTTFQGKAFEEIERLFEGYNIGTRVPKGVMQLMRRAQGALKKQGENSRNIRTSPNSIKLIIKKGLREYPYHTKRTLLWFSEIDRLARDKNLEVSIQDWFPGGLAPPSIVTIKRKA